MADLKNPLIVQSDRTILVEVDHPHYEDARGSLARFAELEKSPEHIHVYRLSPLSLWNADLRLLFFCLNNRPLLFEIFKFMYFLILICILCTSKNFNIFK